MKPVLKNGFLTKRGKQFFIGGELLEFFDQGLGGFNGAKAGQTTPESFNLLAYSLGFKKQFLLAGGAFGNINGRENAVIGDFP